MIIPILKILQFTLKLKSWFWKKKDNEYFNSFIWYIYILQAKNRIKEALEDEYKGFVDSKLQMYDKEQMKRMINCAAICVYNRPQFRPSIKKVKKKKNCLNIMLNCKIVLNSICYWLCEIIQNLKDWLIIFSPYLFMPWRLF